jgi:hypothetical protein
MKYIWLSVTLLALLTACQHGKQNDPLILGLQADNVCQTDFGLTPDTSNFQDCKKWVFHYLRTGIEPDFATFVCDAEPTKQHDSCIEKQQAVYQEMVRVNKEIEALRKEERARRVANAERTRQEQVNKQKQADHLKCAGYGLKKGTAGYAECRMKVEAERVNAEKIGREMQALQWQQKQQLAAQAQEQQRRAAQRNFNAGLAIMRGVAPHEAFMMQDNPMGYQAYQQRNQLNDIQGALEKIRQCQRSGVCY